jgi:hypothetical protein
LDISAFAVWVSAGVALAIAIPTAAKNVTPSSAPRSLIMGLVVIAVFLSSVKQ